MNEKRTYLLPLCSYVFSLSIVFLRSWGLDQFLSTVLLRTPLFTWPRLWSRWTATRSTGQAPGPTLEWLATRSPWDVGLEPGYRSSQAASTPCILASLWVFFFFVARPSWWRTQCFVSSPFHRSSEATDSRGRKMATLSSIDLPGGALSLNWDIYKNVNLFSFCADFLLNFGLWGFFGGVSGFILETEWLAEYQGVWYSLNVVNYDSRPLQPSESGHCPWPFSSSQMSTGPGWWF